MIYSCDNTVENEQNDKIANIDSVGLLKNDSVKIVKENKNVVSFYNPQSDTVMNNVYLDSKNKINQYYWFTKDREILNNLLISENDTIFSNNVFLDSIIFDNNTWLILLTENKPKDFNFHSSAPYLEIIVFEKNENKWILSFRNLFARLGSWGQIPRFELKQIGKDRYGILFFMGYTNQGYTVENLLLYAINRKEINNVLEIKDAAMDNKGAANEKKWGYKYDIRFIDSNLEYYDINFSTKGTYLDDDSGKIKTINKEIVYSFQNEGYMAK